LGRKLRTKSIPRAGNRSRRKVCGIREEDIAAIVAKRGAPMPPPSPVSESEPLGTAERQKGKRGRPPNSTDPEVARRKQEMLDAWDRGDFGSNKAAAGRAFDFHRSDASKIINDHERSKM